MNPNLTVVRWAVHRAVPAHFNDPVGLAVRLLRSGPDALFSVTLAGLTLAAAPLDAILAARERELYCDAEPPKLPILVVCGPPRSGTTVFAQAVARVAPVSYFTNLTAMFPRSPITMSRILHVHPKGEWLKLRSHYGRASGFHGWNDGLHFWDQWLGSDRSSASNTLEPRRGEAMVRFLGAYERWTRRPLVAKNNSLNGAAAEVARFLPTAHFVCLDRDPLFLGQSLLRARLHIHGDATVPYGIHERSRVVDDPVADVCHQVRFHRQLAHRQRELLGPERFRIVDYGEFCRNPREVVRAAAGDTLGLSLELDRIPKRLHESRAPQLPGDEFERLREALALG